MSTRFPPSREADLKTFSNNFKQKITASPTTYGLTAAQATSYTAADTAFVNAFNATQDPATRSPMTIAEKNDAKATLIAQIRLLAGIVQRFPGTTNAMRIDLGLPTRNPEPTPVPAPSTAPLLEVKGVTARTVRLRLIDPANPTRRGKPAGVQGAAVFSYVGPTPPTNLSDWKFEGNATRTVLDVQFPDSVAPFTLVWLAACWFNPRAQSGPASTPVSTNLGAGLTSLAA